MLRLKPHLPFKNLNGLLLGTFQCLFQSIQFTTHTIPYHQLVPRKQRKQSPKQPTWNRVAFPSVIPANTTTAYSTLFSGQLTFMAILHAKVTRLQRLLTLFHDELVQFVLLLFR